MPTTYTHDLFGKAVFQKLPEEIRKIIHRNKTEYLIGLHGPDILFYYRPFHRNEVNQTGHRMHEEIAADFFRHCKRDILLPERKGYSRIRWGLSAIICWTAAATRIFTAIQSGQAPAMRRLRRSWIVLLWKRMRRTHFVTGRPGAFIRIRKQKERLPQCLRESVKSRFTKRCGG